MKNSVDTIKALSMDAMFSHWADRALEAFGLLAVSWLS